MRRIGLDTAYLLLGLVVSAVAFALFLTTVIVGGLLALTLIGLPIGGAMIVYLLRARAANSSTATEV